MNFSQLSDASLLAELGRLVAQEREDVALVVACMAELEGRGALGKTATPDLFSYCVKVLRMTEDTAYRRVRSVAVVRRRVEALSFLRSGDVSLTTLALIEPHLAARPRLLEEIKGKSKREVEKIVAQAGEPVIERPDRIRIVKLSIPDSASQARLPVAMPLFAPTEAPMPTPPTQSALAVEVRFTAAEEFLSKIELMKALLWHKHPAGRLADLLEEAVSEYIERRNPARLRKPAVARSTTQRSRHIPAAVRRQVRLRDGDRCAYVDAAGRRCEERRSLQLDHVKPYAHGGASDDAGNLRLLCAAHNRAEARRLGLGLQLG